ncbi:predicted protein [Lichtheimia corymbifera JMRC:FSU:9682]|uniref:Uncharacterized protein n=1 Tax=Lichtheimia corymbifera JMRC:FSU:9682 TaxID=1263082 RepID=A0A068RTF4_9FUNG|nr:predicted protein [Lichtheimia corymbifera JMRC:FSU:9682]
MLDHWSEDTQQRLWDRGLLIMAEATKYNETITPAGLSDSTHTFNLVMPFYYCIYLRKTHTIILQLPVDEHWIHIRIKVSYFRYQLNMKYVHYRVGFGLNGPRD